MAFGDQGSVTHNEDVTGTHEFGYREFESGRQAQWSHTRRWMARQRDVQAELDRRAAEMEERRQAETALLGQVNRPPTQHVFGEEPNE